MEDFQETKKGTTANSEYLPKEFKVSIPLRYLHIHFYCFTIHNNQDTEPA